MAETAKKKNVKNNTRGSITSLVKKEQTVFNPLNKINQFSLLKNRKTVLGAVIIIAGLLALIFIFKGLFIASLVNGEPISRLSIIKTLEKQGGKATLDSLVTKKIIAQEVKKRNITISQSDIDGEINKITESLKAQGTTIDQALTVQGMTRVQLNDEIKLQLSVQKMVGKDVEVSDKEIDEFIKANKAQFPEGTSEEQIKTQSTERIKQQKLQQKTQEFIKNLQDKAKITNFVQY
ncbi:MAG: SurA N-terminal domain-containing protein [Patescibacteria group bacterium]